MAIRGGLSPAALPLEPHADRGRVLLNDFICVLQHIFRDRLRMLRRFIARVFERLHATAERLHDERPQLLAGLETIARTHRPVIAVQELQSLCACRFRPRVLGRAQYASKTVGRAG